MAENWDQHRIPASYGGAGPSKINPDFSNNFDEGLRVLVYAQNHVNLINYATRLRTNEYEVYVITSEEEAMNQLCKHWNTFDIALLEVHKPEGYIFQSIAQIRKRIDCPIIIISKDASKASVAKWISNGAWDCLVDPISNNDLKYLFKHVVAMRVRRSMVAGEKAAGEKSSFSGPNYNGDHSSQASTSTKKRCVWEPTLHEKFVDAVKFLGTKKANPKAIVARMGDPNLTRDNIASHLQKYRQKEKEKEKKEKEKENSINISEDKTNNVGENPNILLPYPIPSSFSHHNGEVSVARDLMPHQQISEQQNIMNSNILMSHRRPSSFGPHHGEDYVARVTHQPISEQQNILNPYNLMPHLIASSFRPHHGEISVAHPQYQTPRFFAQQNLGDGFFYETETDSEFNWSD